MHGGAQRRLRVDIEATRNLNPGKQQIPNLVLGRVISNLRKLGLDISKRNLDAAVPVEAGLGSTALVLRRQCQPWQRGRNTVERRDSLFLGGLDRLPVRLDGRGIVGNHIAKDVWVATHQLVVDLACHIADGEGSPLGCEPSVKEDLVEQVTKLLEQVVIKLGMGLIVVHTSAGIERFEDLMGLLKQVTAKAGVGLGLIPRALVAKHSDELIESSELMRDRLGHLRDEQRREVVRIEHAIDLRPRHLDNLLVGEAEVMEKHGARWWFLERKFDVGHHMVGVRVGHEQRPCMPGRSGREHMTVDQPNPGLDRIEAEAGPHQVEERNGWQQLDLDPVDLPKQGDAVLKYQRRARDCEDDMAMRLDIGLETVADLDIDIGESIGRLVDLIEGRSDHDLRRRMPGSAKPHFSTSLEGGSGLWRDEFGTGGTKSDDRQPAHDRDQPRTPDGVSRRPVTGSQEPKRAST